jgi:hypothetical protein
MQSAGSWALLQRVLEGRLAAAGHPMTAAAALETLATCCSGSVET